MRNPYEVLGVDKNVTPQELKSKYRKLAKKYHPDLNGGSEEAAEKLKEVNEAYAILSDSEKKSMYDRYGDAAFDQSSGFGGAGGFGAGMGDIFSDIFGDFFGGGRSYSRRVDPNAPKKGSDMEMRIRISFRDSVHGVEKEISYRRTEKCDECSGSGAEKGTKKETCSKCKGTGQVRRSTNTPFGQFTSVGECDHCGGQGYEIKHKCKKCSGHGSVSSNVKIKVNIPAGISDGAIIPIRSKGNAGVNGGPNGDLYIIVSVEEHEVFKRRGNDIYYELPISYTTAALGNEIDIPTLDGTMKFTIPSGTQNDTKFKIKSKGIKDVRTKIPGDLYFITKIIVPKKLSNEEKEKLKELAEVSGEKIKQEHKSFFDKLRDLIN